MKLPAPNAVPIDSTTEARLRAYAALLHTWNRRINLISSHDEAVLWERHILDSAQLAPLLPPPPASVIDLGSGAGFPGLVLSLVARRHVHLIEPDVRKAAFLREAIRVAQVDAEVHATRAETLGIAPANVITARGLAPLTRLLVLAEPLLLPGGICLFPKGRTVEDELTVARREWHMQVECFASRTDPAATLLRLRGIGRVNPNG